jgi:hypothetical protein
MVPANRPESPDFSQDLNIAMLNVARRNHYVPQWYQRRFLPAGAAQFFYLDLKPDTVISPGGKKYQRRSLLRWGPPSCFCVDDLYTVKLGQWSTDAIERQFFGPIDAKGEKAVRFLIDYGMRDGAHEAFEAIMPYMSAQRFRTPRGLDYIRHAINVHDQNIALGFMQRVFQTHATMWTEGVWEVARARQSHTKFILTDEPVTFYNPKVFPLSPSIPYPLDADLSELGTRTIFPLSMDACLIITHLQFVRDPWINPRRPRVNARSFASAMFDLRSIQTDRELEQDEVLRINFILKKRATRYIAAAEEQWLYPEKFASVTHWSKLDEDWFLLPNLYKVGFSGGMMVGYKDGSSWVADEYGRAPRDPEYQNKAQQEREWSTAQEAKLAWAVKREGRSLARDHDDTNDMQDEIMQEQLERYHADCDKKSAGGRVSNKGGTGV